jgi:hypothetical protein
MSAISWQIVLIDGLFLCLAAGIGLWFRGWLKHQQRQLDQRLEILEAQHARLERVSGRLQTVCRVLELMGREGGAVEREKPEVAAKPTPPPSVPSQPVSQREADFERAWQMLTEGTEPTAVAQRLDMGVAEVELMQRMLRYRRQG